MREKIQKLPRHFIAQNQVTLSKSPTLSNQKIEERFVDLRPFVLSTPDIKVIPGALTRVASNGSLVVNSSQGGSSKDTWILGA